MGLDQGAHNIAQQGRCVIFIFSTWQDLLASRVLHTELLYILVLLHVSRSLELFGTLLIFLYIL